MISKQSDQISDKYMYKKGSMNQVIKEESLSDDEEFSFYHLKEGENGKQQLLRLR